MRLAGAAELMESSEREFRARAHHDETVAAAAPGAGAIVAQQRERHGGCLTGAGWRLEHQVGRGAQRRDHLRQQRRNRQAARILMAVAHVQLRCGWVAAAEDVRRWEGTEAHAGAAEAQEQQQWPLHRRPSGALSWRREQHGADTLASFLFRFAPARSPVVSVPV